MFEPVAAETLICDEDWTERTPVFEIVVVLFGLPAAVETDTPFPDTSVCCDDVAPFRDWSAVVR
jgi:hypothetical protein